jgi:hypothetical protein
MEAGWRLEEHMEEDRPAEGKTTITRPSDRELAFTRVFDAPHENSCSKSGPIQITSLTQWWEPRGFTITSLEMDAKPGGVWRLIMHSRDGVDYKNRTRRREKKTRRSGSP